MKTLTITLVALVFGLGRSAQAAIITFDEVASGTVINTVYEPLGVSFVNPLGLADIFAVGSTVNASPPNVVSVTTGFFGAFDARSGAVEASFLDPVAEVSIDAAIVRLPEGLGTPVNAPRLEVYDTGGALIHVSVWDFALIPQPDVGEVTDFQTLSFVSSLNNIGSVRFLSGQPMDSPSNFGVFDNLAFEQTQVPEPGSLMLLGAGLAALARRRSVTRCRKGS